MIILLYTGVVLFFLGLLLSHVVVGITRSLVRAKKPMRKVHHIMMWGAVGLSAIGLLLGGIAYFSMTSGFGSG